MERNNSGRPDAAVMATVYLKSRSGRSALDEAGPVRDATPYMASPETLERAVNELQKLGFKVEGRGITLSISGPASLFERVFGVRISPGESAAVQPGSRPVMKIKGLEDVIEGVTLAGHAVLF